MVKATVVPTTPLQIQTRRQKLLNGNSGTPPTPHRIELRSDPTEELIGSKKPLIISQPQAPKAKRKLITNNHFNNGTNNEANQTTTNSQTVKDNTSRQKNNLNQLQQHKLTEYFPVRRSVRKTKTTVLEEKQLALERMVRSDVEDGLEIRFFEEKGRGIVAAKEFNKGDFVVEYVGQLVDIMEAKERESIYAENENAGCYMYYFKHNDQQYCIDATKETNRLGRLVNHSRNGNLMTKVIMIDGRPRLVLIANRNIKIGEEFHPIHHWKMSPKKETDHGNSPRSAGDTLGAGGGAAGGAGGDDGIVGGPRTPQQIAAQKRLQQTQAQVDEVVDIMKTNVEKVLERDSKLSELDDRADALQQGASQFEQQAGKLKRKFWLQNLKMMIIMGVIGLVILIIIVMKFMPEDKGQQQIQYIQPPQGAVAPAPAPGGATGAAAALVSPTR